MAMETQVNVSLKRYFRFNYFLGRINITAWLAVAFRTTVLNGGLGVFCSTDGTHEDIDNSFLAS